jgi:2-polyprenyl-3-methyl-5-hydroxy-6-metoxy-1,4-benzoquinol methylase
MSDTKREDFMPALRFGSLTRLFDPVVAATTREGAFKRVVIELADLKEGEAALDLGCGTGTLALMAYADAPGAEIVGLDADPEILASARRKASQAGARIGFDEGMSVDMPYGDARFDVVLSTLFFHHLADPDKRATAAELLRVLKPGGRLVIADIGRPQDPVMRLTALATVQLLDGFPTTSLNVAGGLPALMGDAGFENVGVVDRLRTPVGTIEVLTANKAD